MGQDPEFDMKSNLNLLLIFTFYLDSDNQAKHNSRSKIEFIAHLEIRIFVKLIGLLLIF